MKDKIIEILNREIYLEEGSVRTSEIGVGGFKKAATEIVQLLTTEGKAVQNVGAEEWAKDHYESLFHDEFITLHRDVLASVMESYGNYFPTILRKDQFDSQSNKPK